MSNEINLPLQNSSRLILSWIKISNANWFADIEVHFGHPISVIIGKVATGKTTLLKIIQALMKNDVTTFLRFLQSRYFLSDPSVEYHLNPTYFAIHDFPDKTLGILIKNQSVQFADKTSTKGNYTAYQVLDLVQKKIKIKYIDENACFKAADPFMGSMGKQLISGFQNLTKDLKDHLLLIDDLFAPFEGFNESISQKMLELSNTNQIILVCRDSIKLDELLVPNIVGVFNTSLSQMETRLIHIVLANTKFLQTLMESISSIKALLDVPLENPQLRQAHNMMLFANIITALETYLSDAFINTVVNDNTLILKLSKTDSELLKWQFTLADVLERNDDVHQKIIGYLLDIIWHNIGRVSRMYKTVLEIKFPDYSRDIADAIQVRHDIIHRSGKKKANLDEKWIISTTMLSETIDLVNNFVTCIDDQLKKKPWQVRGIVDFPVGSQTNSEDGNDTIS